MITMPRGAAIPYPLDHAFCLFARLYPEVKPYTVLETAAGFYKMHGLTGLIAGIICFVLSVDIWTIAGITFLATLGGYLMSVYAIYPPGFLRLSRVYSLVTGYGLILIAVSVVGLLTVGWLGTAVFWTSRLFAEIVTMWHAKRLGQKYLDFRLRMRNGEMIFVALFELSILVLSNKSSGPLCILKKHEK